MDQPPELFRLQARLEQIDATLRDLHEGKLSTDDPTSLEASLLEELDRMEYEAGLLLYPQFREDGRTGDMS